MDNRDLISKLNEYITIKENQLYQYSIDVNEMNMIDLRDILLGMGTILDEDFNNQTYIINILSGFASKNPAVVAVKLDRTKLIFAAYAKEGLISQHTAEKAVKKIVNNI